MHRADESGEENPGKPSIRVVVFGRGPQLDRDVEEFLCRLEQHPRIEVAGGFFEAPGRGWLEVIRDTWQRRGVMAIALIPLQLGRRLASWVADPSGTLARRRRLDAMAARLHFVPDLHATQVLERVRQLRPGLGLIYGAPILRPGLFELPRHGTLGIHHGKLPEYRGVKTTFWAMARGEETAGVTIQRVNAGLDTGEMVKTGDVPIGDRSRRRVWRELEELGLRLYVEAIEEVADGTATFRPQTGTPGRLYRDPGIGDLARFTLSRLRRRLSRGRRR